MAGIALGAIGDVIVSNDVAALKHRIAFAAVVDWIGAGAQDTVHPPCAAIETIENNSAVELPLRVARPRSAKRVEIGRVEEVGRFLEKCDFLRRLDPAAPRPSFWCNRRAAPAGARPRISSQCAAAHIVLLDADALPGQPCSLYHLA